jgi:hypothetical protein
MSRRPRRVTLALSSSILHDHVPRYKFWVESFSLLMWRMRQQAAILGYP